MLYELEMGLWEVDLSKLCATARSKSAFPSQKSGASPFPVERVPVERRLEAP
jgi:hypothetical protein